MFTRLGDTSARRIWQREHPVRTFPTEFRAGDVDACAAPCIMFSQAEIFRGRHLEQTAGFASGSSSCPSPAVRSACNPPAQRLTARSQL
eukprot:1127506-Pleurochrysis_carterae.AAC.1